jgi:hypothetical protein
MRIIFFIIVQLIFIISVNSQVIKQQVSLEGNNMRTYIWNTGVFNQDLRTNNTPGLEWPRGSGKYACFTAGLCIAGYINNELRMGVASYNGEYRPGYSNNGQFFTDSRFKFYKIKRGDNYITNTDWLNWGLMVPYGAPYVDANNSGFYEYFADTPGVKLASETIFICITDGDSLIHTLSEGFGGGTKPLYAEVHMTAWCYDNPGYQDMQFIKWEVINKSISRWDSIYFAIVSDPDLGNVEDDYVGCDTLRNLGYCYNADNTDGDGTGRTYGLNPPATGFSLLNCSEYNPLGMTSIGIFRQFPGNCEWEVGSALQAYNYITGFKRDGTPWVIPFTDPPKTTKFIYPGDPETGQGWTEYGGKVHNCNGSLYGNTIVPVPPSDRKLIISSGSKNLSISPGQKYTILAAQLITRGTNNLNSVTKLKEAADVAKNLCQNGFVIGINPISTEIPNEFGLHQNYPNPFNPVTKIKFEIPLGNGRDHSTLIIYNAIGREISTLVNEKLNAGVYSVDWDGTNYPSGVYFYQFISGSYIETRKMALIK